MPPVPRPAPGGSNHVAEPCSHSVFTVFALLAVLVLASLPAQARPVRHPATDRHAVAASGENSLVRIWSFLVNLWPRERRKE